MATNITKVKYEKATIYGVEQNISVWVTYTGGDKWSVPINDNDNTKWQEVQLWVADGNTIEEAD
tara:strand:+ start:760 stop:951 length:192 start_codon:yes stop_codon:yes gene_type:complete